MAMYLNKGKRFSLPGIICIAAITLGGCSSIDMREAIHGVARGIATANIQVVDGDEVVLTSYHIDGKIIEVGKFDRRARTITRTIRDTARAAGGEK